MPSDRCQAPCEHPCLRNVYAKGLCVAHYRRLLVGKPLDTPVRDHAITLAEAESLLNEAAVAFVEADDLSRGLEVARARLRKAARRFVRIEQKTQHQKRKQKAETVETTIGRAA